MTGSVDLNPNHLGTVKAILAEHVPECEVRAFGSRATWTAKDYSDLDLAVVGEGPLDWRTLDRLKEAFEESDLPMRVDVLDWHNTSESFREVIEREYEVLQQGPVEPTVRTEQSTMTLDDVADIVMGQSPSGDTVSPDDGVALLNGPTEFGSHHPTPAQYTTDARKLAQAGDLLFCVRGSTTGRMNWADQQYAIGRGVAAIRHRHDLTLQPFVRGVIEVELSELLTRATGSTFPNVSARQLAEIPYPSLSETEQRAIAHVLGTLDDKIELNRRMNETLEGMARALFKSWFVDFEPVRAKMEGRWRRGESLPGLPAEQYDLFSDRFVDSELGEIPEGWRVKALGELCTLRAGSVFRKASQGKLSGKYPFIKVSDMNLAGNSVGILYANNWVDEDELRQLKTTPFPDDTTVFAKIGEGLRQNRIRLLLRPTMIDNNMMGAVPNANVIDPIILFYALSQFDFGEVAGGTALPYLTASALQSLIVPVPPLEEQIPLAEPLRFMYRRHIANEIESHTLTAQRDVLLPKVVSGDLSVTVTKQSFLDTDEQW